MNTTLTELESNDSQSTESRIDQTLGEIRTGRRLTKIVASVEGFLNNQIERISAAVAECQQVAENDAIVQRLWSEFENEKLAWSEKRQQEIDRLNQAGEKLAEGWKRLESERRKFLDEQVG